jgi:hypothetical protein
VIVHQAEIEPLMAASVGQAVVTQSQYLVVGTVNPRVWRRGLSAGVMIDELIQHMADFKAYMDVEYPEPFSHRPVRVKEAERLIRHYRQATNDAEDTVDLMLSFVEAGTDQAADLGYGEERYFGALERALDGVAATLAELAPDSRRCAVARIQQIAARADSIGWGYCDYAREIATQVSET